MKNLFEDLRSLMIAISMTTCAVLFLAEVSNSGPTDEAIEVSKDCVTTLLAVGTTAGVGVALTPVAMCTAGFCTAGIAGGSLLAAWWQSTMPLVQVGGLFATLQALEMASTGNYVTVTGTSLGGTVGLAHLQDICAFVDETDPDSVGGKLLKGSVFAVGKAVETKDFIASECAASETCTAAKTAASETVTATKAYMFKFWDAVKEGQPIQAVKESPFFAGNSTVSSYMTTIWDDIKERMPPRREVMRESAAPDSNSEIDTSTASSSVFNILGWKTIDERKPTEEALREPAAPGTYSSTTSSQMSGIWGAIKEGFEKRKRNQLPE